MPCKYKLQIKKFCNKSENNKRLIEYLNKHSNIFTIVWVNNKYTNIFNGRYYANIKELKRQYPGQSYLYYPIHKFNLEYNKIAYCVDDNEPSILNTEIDGYIIVSKRGFRTEFSYLKYDKISKLKEKIDEKVREYIFTINLYEINNLHECELINKETNEILDTIFVVHTNEISEIFKYVIDNTKILDANINNVEL